MNLRRLAGMPLHPFLIGALPVLHFWEKNFRLVSLGEGRDLLLVLVATAGLLLAVGRLLLGDTGRAALVAAPLMLVVAKGEALGSLPSIALLLAVPALGLLLARRRPEAAPFNAVLNAVLLVLLVFPVAGKLRAEARENPPHPRPSFTRDVGPVRPVSDRPPDVYFLLVDGLGQPALVEELFRLPQRELTAGLERRGFRLLPASRSNYAQTAQSMAATFNQAVLTDLLDIPDPRCRDRRPLRTLVEDNRAVRTLRAGGYRIVTFPSGYPLTRLAAPDDRREPAGGPSFLEFYALNDGILPLLQRWLGRGPGDWSNALHRRRLDYIFDGLSRARDGAGPQEPVFVFAHILSPHPPFVYGPGGAPLGSRGTFAFGDGNDWVNANVGETVPYGVFWRNQARHVLARLEEAVDGILAASPRPPVIVIQGDHGPGSQLHWDHPQLTNHNERFGIFNAWLVPDDLPLALRADQTSLATFGTLFAGLFGQPAPALQEGHWFARMKHPYELFEVGR